MAILADVWRRVFDTADEIGVDSIVVPKVAAHRAIATAVTMNDVLEIHANWLADEHAKDAADWHPVSQLANKRALLSYEAVKVVGKFAASCMAWFVDNLPPFPENLRRVRQFQIPEVDSRRHEPAWDPQSKRWRCVAEGCFQSATTTVGLTKALCTAHGTTHQLWRLEQYLFCIECGAYTQAKTVRLKLVCGIAPSSSSACERRNRMKAGMDPISNLLIGVPRPLGLFGEHLEVFLEGNGNSQENYGDDERPILCEASRNIWASLRATVISQEIAVAQGDSQSIAM